jgi:hypothetical protein
LPVGNIPDKNLVIGSGQTDIADLGHYGSLLPAPV